MNGNGDAIRAIIPQGTLTSFTDSKHAPVPHAPQRAVSLGSQDQFVDERLRVGNEPITRLLTVAEVAALLNVPRKWVYRRVVLKPPEGMPHIKVGKYLRFRESDVRNYVDRLHRN